MEIPVGMKEVFSSSDETDQENTFYKQLKGKYMVMSISKTILEKFVDEMIKTEIGFKISEADPCLLVIQRK